MRALAALRQWPTWRSRTASTNNGVRVTTMRADERLRRGPAVIEARAAACNDGDDVALPGCGSNRHLRSADQWRLWAILESDHASEAAKLALSHDGETIATAIADEPITLWDIRARKVKATLPCDPRFTVSCLAFNPKRELLASAQITFLSAVSKDRNVPGAIVWDTATGKQIASVNGHSKRESDDGREVYLVAPSALLSALTGRRWRLDSLTALSCFGMWPRAGRSQP